MARDAKGSKYKSRGVWYAVITVAQRKRESFAMPLCQTDEEAEARTRIVNDVVQRLRAAGHAALVQRFAKEAAERPAGKDLTRIVNAVTALACGQMVPNHVLSDSTPFREIGESWTSGKMSEEYRGEVVFRKGAKDIAHLLEKHVYPLVGEVPIGLFGPDHGRLVLKSYPEAYDPGSVRNIAKLIHRIVNLAVSPLKLIAFNPFPRGWIPKLGPAKSRTCVYPDEDVQLMACADVPLGLRVLWGYLHREGHRKGEAFLLTWSHFNLKLGTINMDNQNKTKEPRFWVLAPGVAALLRAWKRYREEVLGERLTGADPVFFANGERPLGTRNFHAARVYRANLQTAGIDRAQLFQHDANRRRVRAHDTRAAFVTIALANGRGEIWISDRTGHCSMDDMKTYRRNARALAQLNVGDWKPFDTAIPELLPYLAEASEAVHTARSSGQAPASPAFPAPPAPASDTAASALPLDAAETAPGSLPAAVVEPGAEPGGARAVTLPGAAAEAPGDLADATACADATVACETAHEVHGGELVGAALVCTSEPNHDARTASVGASVGAPVGRPVGASFTRVEIPLDLPLIREMQSLPTFAGGHSSSETAP